MITGKRQKPTMKNPPHPGYSIKQNCVEPLGLNVTILKSQHTNTEVH